MATFIAALGILTMSSGVVLMTSASAAVGPNQEEYWETLPGEICTKTDVGANSGGYTVPAVPQGYVWSKLIIKKGSGNIGIENQVFNDPVVGQTYTWIGFNPQQSGGWSHTILCRVPAEDEPELATASISVTQPTCENDNTPAIGFSGDNVVLPFDVAGTIAPGQTVTVTATAVAGAEFAGGSATKIFDDVEFDEAEKDCDIIVLPPEEATASISVTQPTCENDNTPAIGFSGDNVVLPFGVDGTVAPGETVTVTATAVAGAEFAGGSTAKVFPDVVFDQAEGGCDIIVLPPKEVTPVAPQFVDPTCATEADLILPEPSEEPEIDIPLKVAVVVETADVDGVHYEVSGDIVPGGTVEVTASAIAPAVLADDVQTFWTHTFPELEGCEEVEPPVETPPLATPVAITPTVVSSGVVPTAKDLRGEQGLALLVTGMILTVLAGALGAVRPGGARN